MKKLINKLRKRKLLTTLIVIIIVAFIIGVLFMAIISKNNQELVKKTLNDFFLGLKSQKLTYDKAIISSLTSNMLINFIIWLLGISIIGLPLIIIILVSKSFILGFSISSIIYNYHFKGIIYAMIYVIPHIINLFIILVLGYYSIKFSIMLFNLLFRKKEYSKRIIVKNYIRLLIYSTVLFTLSSIIEVYMIPNILKLL